MAKKVTKRYAAWSAQPGPQDDAITATWCSELLFGGARGGGKSQFILADFLQDVTRYGQHWQGILFRRSMPELDEVIRASHDFYPLTGATWREQKKEWHWPNGACLRMRYLERIADVSRYQGHSFSWIGFDELGQWPDAQAYNMIKACLRWMDAEIPTKRIRATANPGGPGHQWIKNYFIDFAPAGYVPFDDPVTGMTRMYIPSLYSDNKIGQIRDPGYTDRLKGVGSPELVRAWLEGDWNAVTGAYFPEFANRHIIEPHKVPSSWLKFRCLDWGYASPFCCLWIAVSDGTTGEPDYESHFIPAGALVVYREWYGALKPNEGMRMVATDVAQGILGKESEKIVYSVADPSIFKVESGPSVAEMFLGAGVGFRRGDNARLPGWEQIRYRLQKDPALLYVFHTCTNLIRTLPTLQHDVLHVEDLDTHSEDHAADALRYGCMSRPFVLKNSKKKEEIKYLHQMTYDELFKANEELVTPEWF